MVAAFLIWVLLMMVVGGLGGAMGPVEFALAFLLSTTAAYFLVWRRYKPRHS